MTTVERYRGVGRGAKTRDGCSVDLYLRLPYLGEVELLQPLLPTMASVIELGCGVGRITRELLAHGYRVTAVDNSPEMLAHVPEQASKICADIEDLSVQETFDAVIFASCLINVPDVACRTAQLAKCRDLLKADGRLILERYDPTWLSDVQVGVIGNIGNVQMHINEAHQQAWISVCAIAKMERSGYTISLQPLSMTPIFAIACRRLGLARLPGLIADGQAQGS